MDNKGFTLRRRLASFKYAFRGIGLLLAHEHSAWLQGLIAVGTIIAGALLQINAMEWAAIIIVSGCVLSAEAMNTAIEKLSNVVSPEYSEAIRRVKDIAAGAVLIMALAAAATGLVIFIPKLL